MAAAQAGDCRVLLTEDLQHGQKFGRVRVIDPFASPERSPAELLASMKAEPPPGMDAVSLRPLVEGTRAAHRPVAVSALADWRMVTDERHKQVVSPAHLPLLFDRTDDEWEDHNLSAARPEVVDELRMHLVMNSHQRCADRATCAIRGTPGLKRYCLVTKRRHRPTAIYNPASRRHQPDDSVSQTPCMLAGAGWWLAGVTTCLRHSIVREWRTIRLWYGLW